VLITAQDGAIFRPLLLNLEVIKETGLKDQRPRE